MSRTEAAEYVGVSLALFDEMVKDSRMPPPRQINRRLVWSRPELETRFEHLPCATIQGETEESNSEWELA